MQERCGAALRWLGRTVLLPLILVGALVWTGRETASFAPRTWLQVVDPLPILLAGLTGQIVPPLRRYYDRDRTQRRAGGVGAMMVLEACLVFAGAGAIAVMQSHGAVTLSASWYFVLLGTAASVLALPPAITERDRGRRLTCAGFVLCEWAIVAEAVHRSGDATAFAVAVAGAAAACVMAFVAASRPNGVLPPPGLGTALRD